jgi:hypothetical protein
MVRRDDAEFLGIRVECYAGHRAEEEPRRFWVGERCVQVEAIVDRWLGPDHRYFRVTGGDGRTYLLRHDGRLDLWEITQVSG